MKTKATNRYLEILIVLGIIIFSNILVSFTRIRLDFSEDKKFTLTEATMTTLEELPEQIFIRILLDGDFPSGFKKLQQSIRDLLIQFKHVNSAVEFSFENPNEGTLEEVNSIRERLAKDGLMPINLKVNSGTEQSEQLIYPYAIINLGERKIAINLLEHQAELDQEANLNNSISQLEYKMINAIEKVLRKEKKNILLTNSNGELSQENTMAIETMLKPFYNVIRMSLDSITAIRKEVDLVIIAKPTITFSEQSKFKLDQYLMNGGSMLWFVDAMQISIDSFTYRKDFIPEPLDLNLSDLFFNYGIRIEPSLVLDLECSKIAQVIGKIGDKPQIELFPWYYFPVPAPYSNHPVINNIDRILMDFPSKIDTVKTKYPVRKNALIVSSPYSRYQLAPARVGFDMLRYKPDPSKFNNPQLIMGILLEGQFNSPFENRLDPSMQSGLAALGMDFKPVSDPAKVIVVADGDVIRNYADPETGKFSKLGYSKFEKFHYNGNQAFFMNAVEYLTNANNILEARSKEFKIRLLNQVKIQEEKLFWQLINVAGPLLLLIVFAILHTFWRKKRYTS